TDIHAVNNPLMRQSVRDDSGIVQSQGSSYSFVVYEEEGFVLLDRTAYSSAELISMKIRRTTGGVEEVPGVHCAVAEVSVRRSVKFVRSALRNFIDNRNSVILGVRRIRYDLEFGDTRYSKRRTRDVQPGLVSPEAADFHAIQQNRPRVGSSARNAVSLSLSEVCATGRSRLDRRDP